MTKKTAKTLKTTEQLIEFLQQFPSDTRVVISDWDYYNNEPCTRELTSEPYIEEKKKHKIIYF